MSPRWPVSPAAHALGLLLPDEERQAALLCEGDEAFRTEVERFRAAAERLAALPPSAWAAPGEVPPLALAGFPPRPASARRRWRPVLLPAAAALLVGLGIVGGMALERGRSGPGAPAVSGERLVLAPVGAGGGGGRAALPLRPGGTADLLVHGLRPNRHHTYYEAWLMSDARHLVPLGTFTVGRDGRAHVRFAYGADPRRYRYVDVSLQPDNGSAAHSADSVLRAGI